jgi:Fe2+ transport system protein FeoA
MTMTLLQASQDAPLRIVDITGGEAVRRRLFSLGFNIGDRIALAGRSILRGPVLVRNLDLGVTVAVGRGIAQKIMIEAADGTI